MQDFTRRDFFKLSGLSVLPALSPELSLFNEQYTDGEMNGQEERVYFVYDGPLYKPSSYIEKLKKISEASPIEQDFYAEGGVVDLLLKKFLLLTGKEAAVLMPSGTMANQLAIHVLSGDNTKVFVQETSHVYRDEGDAAQSVFNKRLIPLAKGGHAFDLQELQQSMEYYDKEEVFKSGTGVISIENPVRRCDGQAFPIEEIKKIAAWSKEKGYKLHLDGARLMVASAYTGIPVAEYSSYFDTVYISLYKYLGAAGGAVLCGDKNVIDKMNHLIKVHGGSIFSNWANAAMACWHMDGFDARLKSSITKSKELVTLLNQLTEIKIAPIASGTNMYNFSFTPGNDITKIRTLLREKYNIVLGMPREDGFIKLTINETLLVQDNQKIVAAFKSAIKESKA